MSYPKTMNGWIRTRDQFPPMDPNNSNCSKSVIMARYSCGKNIVRQFVGMAHLVFSPEVHWVEEGYYDNKYPKVSECETYWKDDAPDLELKWEA
jgi:hypothetical protein